MANVRYTLAISGEARDQLRALPKHMRQQIGEKLTLLQDNLRGDVKKLAAAEKKYRLRIGNVRVLFRLEADRVSVYAVKDRKEAYE